MKAVSVILFLAAAPLVAAGAGAAFPENTAGGRVGGLSQAQRAILNTVEVFTSVEFVADRGVYAGIAVGRLFCVLLSKPDDRDALVLFLLRCELGNHRFNASHRRTIAIVPKASFIPAVESVLRRQIANLSETFTRVRQDRPR